MSRVMARKFMDGGARLPSRSLIEIKEALEDLTTRIYRAHRVRIGDEPLSLTSTAACIHLWFLSLPDDEQEKIILEQAPEVDRRLALDGPEPIRRSPDPLMRTLGSSEVKQQRIKFEPKPDDDRPKIVGRPSRRGRKP